MKKSPEKPDFLSDVWKISSSYALFRPICAGAELLILYSNVFPVIIGFGIIRANPIPDCALYDILFRFRTPDTLCNELFPVFVRQIHEIQDFLIREIGLAVTGEYAVRQNPDFI